MSRHVQSYASTRQLRRTAVDHLPEQGRLRRTLAPTIRLAGIVATVVGSSLGAQAPDPRCGPGGPAGLRGGDACQKAVDLFGYAVPQIGALIAGGNATLGQGSSLGGLGHFVLTMRVNGTSQLAVPNLDAQRPTIGPARRSDFAVRETPGGLPVVDGAVGLFKGARFHGMRVGGVDALVNVFYVPDAAREALAQADAGVTLPESGLKLGYGVRVGLLEEGRRTPGIGVTYIQRKLPKLTASYALGGADQGGGAEAGASSDTLSLHDLSLQSDSWRVVVGKRFWIFGLAAGAGQDRYRAGGEAGYVVQDLEGERAAGTIALARSVRRTNVFADLSVDLPIVHLVGEIGRTSGGDVATFNRFATPAGAPRVYGSLGVRIGR